MKQRAKIKLANPNSVTNSVFELKKMLDKQASKEPTAFEILVNATANHAQALEEQRLFQQALMDHVESVPNLIASHFNNLNPVLQTISKDYFGIKHWLGAQSLALIFVFFALVGLYVK